MKEKKCKIEMWKGKKIKSRRRIDMGRKLGKK